MYRRPRQISECVICLFNNVLSNTAMAWNIGPVQYIFFIPISVYILLNFIILTLISYYIDIDFFEVSLKEVDGNIKELCIHSGKRKKLSK